MLNCCITVVYALRLDTTVSGDCSNVRTATFTCRCVFLFGYTQQRLVRALRIDLFRSLLQQDIAFFDAAATGNISSRLTSDCAGLFTLNPKP